MKNRKYLFACALCALISGCASPPAAENETVLPEETLQVIMAPNHTMKDIDGYESLFEYADFFLMDDTKQKMMHKLQKEQDELDKTLFKEFDESHKEEGNTIFINERAAPEGCEEAFTAYIRFRNSKELYDVPWKKELKDSGEMYRIWSGPGFEYGYSYGSEKNFYFRWTEVSVKEEVLSHIKKYEEEREAARKERDLFLEENKDIVFEDEFFRDAVLAEEGMVASQRDMFTFKRELTKREVETVKKILQSAKIDYRQPEEEKGSFDYETGIWMSLFDKNGEEIYHFKTNGYDVFVDENVVDSPILADYIVHADEGTRIQNNLENEEGETEA